MFLPNNFTKNTIRSADIPYKVSLDPITMSAVRDIWQNCRPLLYSSFTDVNYTSI